MENQNLSPTIPSEPMCVVLNREHLQYSQSFTGILNESWNKFNPYFPVEESQLVKTLEESNPFFVGAFQDGEPAGIVRTTLKRFEEPNPDLDVIRKAAFICNQVGKFGPLTYDGNLVPYDEDPNTIICIDATVAERFQARNFPNSRVFSGMIDYIRESVSMPSQQRLRQLSRIKYVITFTPNFPPIVRAHEKQHAFSPGVTLKNAREGYNPHPNVSLSDVRFMCYLVQPDLSKAPEYIANEESFNRVKQMQDNMKMSA